MAMSFGTRVKGLREIEGITQKDLAERLQVSKANMCKYESNSIEPSMKTITKIASIFNVSTDYLLGTDGHSPSVFPLIVTPPSKRELVLADLPLPELLSTKTIHVPLVGEIACGSPELAVEDWDDYELTLPNNDDKRYDFCLKAKGDSMTGAGIHEGDVVLVRQQEMVENGEIAAVLIGEESTLKRVYYNEEEGELSLYPENPIYRPQHYRGEALNQIRILGKAITVLSEL
ncbi:MAG: XRE family transcriptional regulator [Eubacteriales bacterium]